MIAKLEKNTKYYITKQDPSTKTSIYSAFADPENSVFGSVRGVWTWQLFLADFVCVMIIISSSSQTEGHTDLSREAIGLSFSKGDLLPLEIFQGGSRTPVPHPLWICTCCGSYSKHSTNRKIITKLELTVGDL